MKLWAYFLLHVILEIIGVVLFAMAVAGQGWVTACDFMEMFKRTVIIPFELSTNPRHIGTTV